MIFLTFLFPEVFPLFLAPLVDSSLRRIIEESLERDPFLEEKQFCFVSLWPRQPSWMRSIKGSFLSVLFKPPNDGNENVQRQSLTQRAKKREVCTMEQRRTDWVSRKHWHFFTWHFLANNTCLVRQKFDTDQECVTGTPDIMGKQSQNCLPNDGLLVGEEHEPPRISPFVRKSVKQTTESQERTDLEFLVPLSTSVLLFLLFLSFSHSCCPLFFTESK